MDIDEALDEILLWVHCKGGHHTEARVARRGRKEASQSVDLVGTIGSLRVMVDDPQMSQLLNRAGIKDEAGQTWTTAGIEQFRRRHGIGAFCEEEKAKQGLLLQAEAAARLAISAMSVHRLIRERILPAQQPVAGFPCVIREADLKLPAVQQAVESIRGVGKRPLSQDSNQPTLI